MTDLRKLLSEARKYVPLVEVQCNGLKCREGNCLSCFSEESVREYIEESRRIASRIDAALAEPVAGPDVYEFNIAHFHQTGGITSTKYTKECKTENAAYRHFLTLLEKHKVDERTYYLCKWKFLPPDMVDIVFADQWRRVEDGLLYIDYLVCHYDWTRFVCNTALPESDKCEHGKGLTDYCQPCGRING